MKLNKNQLELLRERLQAIFPAAFTLYPNGIFNALDVDEASKDKLLKILNTSGFVKNSSAAHYRNDNGKSLYQIYGILDTTNINEKIELHSKLNPKIWDANNELLPEVRKKINEIVEFFLNELAEDNIKLIINDIYIIGSNANFNYTPESDLDIHIIADQSFDCKSNHLEIIYNAYKSLFNKRYDITINGINVEIYVENSDKIQNISAGVYSLNNGWIKSPTNYKLPEIDEAKLDQLVAKWESRYLKIIDNPTLESVDSYIDDIYELRKEGLNKNSEFSLENLIFKEIRRLGYLDNLKDIHDKLTGDALSL